MDGSAVVLAATLPTEIRPWSGQGDEFANFMDDNVTLLRALLVWDEERSGSEEDDRSTLAHLQIKTDLLLTLLSAGIRAREPLPPRYPCALRGDSLQLQLPEDVHPLEPFSCAALFLRPGLALPLLLPGEGFERIPGESTIPQWQLRFHLSPTVQELLDRLIFRHHRREIARLRESASIRKN